MTIIFSVGNKVKQKEDINMEKPIDKRNTLDEEVFTCRITKDKRGNEKLFKK